MKENLPAYVQHYIDKENPSIGDEDQFRGQTSFINVFVNWTPDHKDVKYVWSQAKSSSLMYL